MKAVRAVSGSSVPASAAWAASQAFRQALLRFSAGQATSVSAASRTLATVRRRPTVSVSTVTAANRSADGVGIPEEIGRLPRARPRHHLLTSHNPAVATLVIPSPVNLARCVG
jgi:hypothetical protein